MKGKKLLSVIIAIAMVLTTMSIPAFAEETVYEASVNGTPYATFTEAVEAAQDDETITLLSGITISDTYTISNTNAITIDFNGFNIDVTGVSIENDSIVIAEGADVTFVDSLDEGGINGYKNCLTNYGGTVTLNGGTYKTTLVGRGSTLFNERGVMNVNSGVKVDAYKYAVYNEQGGTCNLNGGTIVSHAHNGLTPADPAYKPWAYAVINSGTMNIYDGVSIQGIQGGLSATGEGVTNVYGGNIETCEDEEDSTGRSFYACYAANNANLTISGGSFTAAKRSALYVGNEDTGLDGASVQINGGTFKSNGGADAAAVQTEISGTLGICGGTFSSDMSSHVANGYYCKKNADETYTVEECPIVIGETYYSTLADAFSAAQDGDTVKVLSDITLTNNILMKDDKAVTLDLNGKTLSCEGGRIFLLGTDMKVTGNGYISADITKGSQTAIEVQDENSVLTIESANVSAGANNMIIAAGFGGNVIINGGTYTVTNGGTCFYIFDNSSLTINNGVFNGTGNGGPGVVWAFNGSDVNVYGGNFNVENDTTDYGVPSVINWTFCDYRGLIGYSFPASLSVSSKGNVNVYGGTYNVNPKKVPNLAFASSALAALDVDYVADGYFSKANENGTYTVSKSEAKIIDTAKTTGATVTLDNLTKNNAIDHEPDATYKVVVSTAPTDDVAKANEAISANTEDRNTDKAIFDISVVKVDSNGVTTDLGGTNPGSIQNQQVMLTLGDTPQTGSKVFVYHVDDLGNATKVAEVIADGTNKITFTAPSFSTYAVTYTPGAVSSDDITTKVGVVFSPVSAGSNQYYITLKSLDAAKKINRFTSAEIAFKNECATVDYEIAPAANMTASCVDTSGTSRAYRFSMDGFNASSASSEIGGGITIGTIAFGGYGTLDFSVDKAYVSGRAINIVNTTKAADGIVENYIIDGTVGELVVNDTVDSTYYAMLAADESGTITDVLAPATKTLTVNVKFNNAIGENAAAYQAMKAVISGGDLTSDITVDFGGALTDNTYSFTKDLTQNIAYTVTISGDGYRTARYTVTMTENKTLNFWNNVKDAAEVVEVGAASSAVTKNFLAGDIVKDSNINIYDLSAVVSYFGQVNVTGAASAYAKYDLNRDGVVDSKDVAYVLVSWGN